MNGLASTGFDKDGNRRLVSMYANRPKFFIMQYLQIVIAQLIGFLTYHNMLIPDALETVSI